MGVDSSLLSALLARGSFDKNFNFEQLGKEQQL